MVVQTLLKVVDEMFYLRAIEEKGEVGSAANFNDVPRDRGGTNFRCQ